MDFGIILLIIAAFLQIGAVILAFKLIKITKTGKGWILISIALVLMAVRRFYHVTDNLQWDLWEYSHIIFEHYLAVIISITMILGIYYLSDVFREKARIEEKLKETEQFETVLLGSVWTGIWAVDANEKLIYFNNAMEKISGLTSEQVIGTNLLDDMSEQTIEDEAHFRDLFLQAKDSLTSTPYDSLPIMTQGGNLSYQSGVMIPMLDDNGEYGGMICTVEDITEHRKAEKELQKRMNELETFYRATLGREGRVIELKQEVNELLEQLGKNKKYRD